MDFVVDKLQFLGLNEREVHVFTALATFGQMNMTKIAQRADVPRTTVDAIVRRLLKQGLISKQKIGGHYEYFVDADEVANTLDWLEKRLRTDTNLDGVETVAERQKYEENKVFDENIVKQEQVIFDGEGVSLGSIAERHKGDRVRLLFSRGGKGVEDCILRFSKYAHVCIENEIKLEVLLDATVANALVGKSGIPIPPRADMVRLNIVPALYGTAMQDVFMFRDDLLLIHTHREKRELVRENVMVDLAKHLLDIACETGWSVDLTAWMNK